jgi:hypothetical protein
LQQFLSATLLCRYQYVNTPLYDHVMALVASSYYRLCARYADNPANITVEQNDASDKLEDDYISQITPYRKPPSQQQMPPSFVHRDKMQKMHAWLVSRALRSSYLPGRDIVELMAERVERLADERVHMSVRCPH